MEISTYSMCTCACSLYLMCYYQHSAVKTHGWGAFTDGDSAYLMHIVEKYSHLQFGKSQQPSCPFVIVVDAELFARRARTLKYSFKPNERVECRTSKTEAKKKKNYSNAHKLREKSDSHLPVNTLHEDFNLGILSHICS